MKLEKILEVLNSFEKNAFLKIVENLKAKDPINLVEVDKILESTSKDLKTIDSINISKVFNLLSSEFSEYIESEFTNRTSQLDILIDIFIREGNCMMKLDWFGRLYEKELDSLNHKIEEFQKIIEDEKSEITEQRQRDYRIYKQCLFTAYHNDEENNQESKITRDEQSILITLSQQLGLSQEEIKKINYLILPAKKQNIETVIKDLTTLGIIFYSKKTNTIFVADEIVTILRKVRGKELSDKFFRRVLKALREPQINMICKKHGVDWKEQSLENKIKQIINNGISIKDVLSEDIYKDGTILSDKKKYLNDFFDNILKIQPSIKGTLIEDKIDNLIKYYEEIERDEKVSISIDGYEKLLLDIKESLPKTNEILRMEFEFQEEHVLSSSFLLDFNIKPRDVLEIIPTENLIILCTERDIKTRGDIISNILENYKDAENLYLENYENIGFRNFNELKNNRIDVKEADLGCKFEEITKNIFSKLGFKVDEELRNSVNSKNDKIDIILNIGNNEVILVECKTIKESGYNKFSFVSRQLKSYANHLERNNYKVIKSLLVAPDFSDEFVKECGLEYELNLSLITASSLLKILNGFKNSKLKIFPYNLLMRDVLIQEDRVLKAIDK